MLLSHLNSEDFQDLEDMSAGELLSAQAVTAGKISLDAHGDVLDEMNRERVHAAFAGVVAETPPQIKKDAILTLTVPAAVKHLAGMLTAYDWDYINQAKEIRGYVVAKLLEETKHPDARIRLRALELTGRLTEVGSFTDRVEITRRDIPASELEEKIRAKLAKYLPAPQDVTTVTPINS